MSQPNGTWTDERVETILGSLLQFGVILAACVVLGGGLLYLYRYGSHEPQDRRNFDKGPEELRRITGIVHQAVTWHSRGIIQLGLLLLVATPIARVVFAAFAFLRQRDAIYVCISLVVLGVLLFSLVGEH
jgi:uncharacterized membrane protein